MDELVNKANHVELQTDWSIPLCTLVVAVGRVSFMISKGIYTVLYAVCMYILATRKRSRYRPQAFLITVLYVIATVEVGLKLVIHTSQTRIQMFGLISDLRGSFSEALSPQYRKLALNDMHKVTIEASNRLQG
ncbi:hypothetical protein PM082_018484 [Marasmius tenuissimus]|nr:hypothetical protein PM082_018484 [Marasmius tenuissimus]